MSFRSSQVIGSFPTIDVGDIDISIVKLSASIEMSKLRNNQLNIMTVITAFSLRLRLCFLLIRTASPALKTCSSILMLVTSLLPDGQDMFPASTQNFCYLPPD